MVEKIITSHAQRRRFRAATRQGRSAAGRAQAMSARICRHCGAALSEGEREDECSSTFNVDAASLRWQAAQILRGLI